MRVRCPHCHNAIEVVEDSSFRGIVCESCGSDFSLIGGTDDTVSYRGGGKTIGHFTLTEQLGFGAFGTVWKAKDTQLDRTVAIKIPRRGQLNRSETEQFLREARAAAQLKHANIVSVHEVGKDDDAVYIVSDYIEGATLKDMLGGRPLSSRESAELALTIADALQHAHDQGVIHRDLKPGNVMMDLEGKPHVLDFGLAKRESGEITMTVEGALIGTPAYMSPEQARGEGHDADRRSDVYSLGVILFEMLTGELPFRGQKRMLIVQILTDDPPQPRKLNSDVPRDLETICLKCLNKEPEKRYETARDLADDLRRWLDGEPIRARPITRVERGVLWCKRHPGTVRAASLVALLLLIFGIVLQVQRRRNLASRADTSVAAMANAVGPAVPYAIRDLSLLPQEMVASRLRLEFENASGERRRSLAYGIASLPEPTADAFDTLLSSIAAEETSGDEVMNLVRALEPFDDATEKIQERAEIAAKQDDSQTMNRLAIVAWHLGDVSLVRELLRAFPEGPAPPVTMPDRLGYFQKQLETAADQQDPDPANPVMSWYRAESNYYLGRPAEALQDLNEIVKLENAPYEAYAYRAICLASTEKDAMARDAVNALDTVERESVVNYGKLIAEGILLGQEALNRKLDKLLESKPDDAEAFYDAARIAAQASRFPGLEESKTKAVQLLQRAYNDLGYTSKTGAHQDSDFIPLYEDAGFRRLINKFHRSTRSFDPVARTRFISDFAAWSGDLAALELPPDDADESGFRSGVCLALGGVAASEAAISTWTPRLKAWRESATDGGSHSAAEWVLMQWEVPMEPLAPTPAPIDDRDWWAVDDDITMIKIRPGVVKGKNAPGVLPGNTELVKVDREFWISDREINLRLFQRFIDATDWDWPGPHPFDFSKADLQQRPVQQVSWYDAVRFCNWLSEEQGLDACYTIEQDVSNPGEFLVTIDDDATGFRLPRESEWEYACRALTSTKFYFGESESDLVDYGVYGVNSESRTALTRSRKCNPWGLFDMHGNVLEWCQDRGTNDTVSGDFITEKSRMHRGGSWRDPAWFCRSSLSFGHAPAYRDRSLGSLGFRVAATLSAQD